jgi:hypothetical protein
MSEYPEHEKLAAIQDKSQAIGEFLEWLNSDGVRLSRWDERPGWDMLQPDTEGTTAILARYFGIDIKRLDDEKRKMLESVKLDHQVAS